MPTRRLPLLLALLGASLATAEPSSWLLGPQEPAPRGTRPGVFGMAPVAREARAYHHPFGAHTEALVRAGAVAQALPGQAYLLLSEEAPADARENRRLHHSLRRQASTLGLRWLGQPTKGGYDRVPLMGIVEVSAPGPVDVPEGMRLVPVQGARVRLCLLGLGPDGTPAYEVPLQETARLEPATALRRAQGLARYFSPGPRLPEWDLAEIREAWPRALRALEEAGGPEQASLFALRVLWDAEQAEIPGPGGVALEASDPQEARRRLHALYLRR